MSIFKNPPILDGSKSYETWKVEIAAWERCTDLPKNKRAMAIALSLTGKARSQAMLMDINVLNEDNGVTQILAELDKVFQKDAIDLAYDAYTNFDKYVKSDDVSMTDYVTEFEQRYSMC